MVEELEARGQTVEDLRIGLGYDTNELQALLSGTTIIDDSLAERLSGYFGIAASFWINEELRWRSSLARRAEKEEAKLKTASGNVALRIPKNLHARIIDLASDQGVSMNHLLLSMISEGVGRLDRSS